MTGRRMTGIKCQKQADIQDFALLCMTMLAVPSCLDLVHLRHRWSWHGLDTESATRVRSVVPPVLLSEHVPDVFFRRGKGSGQRFTEQLGKTGYEFRDVPEHFRA